MIDPRAASAAIEAANARVAETLPFSDDADFTEAKRGFVAALDPGLVADSDGKVLWNNDSYAFLDEDCPPTVNPSLWRQSKLVAKQGLFAVTDSIYQIRGLDLSNMTLIEGDTGIIVIDPLISRETAAAGLALYREHRGDRPVVAVIYTHSHIDHFGGVKGVTTDDDVAAGRCVIVAPTGLVEHAVEENVYAGTAMARRAAYMYGAALPRGPRGSVGAGLGQTTSTGTPTLISPTVSISKTGHTETIDGVRIEFQMTPGTEAPSEMNFYFPYLRALCMAENATHTLHNLLTLRGALVRDPHVWSAYLTESINRYASRSDVLFASHHWPTWGTERLTEFLSCSATSTGTFTIRHFVESIRGGPVSRSPNRSSCQLHWRKRGTRTGTTVPSVTTSKPSTSDTWVGSTVTLRICGSIHPSNRPSVTWSSWADQQKCYGKLGNRTSAATFAGLRRW